MSGPWGEVKTKPTQHSVIKLREIGIQPDALICRTRLPISDEMKRKISLFCDVEPEAVIEAQDAETIYEVPLLFEAAGLSDLVVKRLGLPDNPPDLTEWRKIVDRLKRPNYEVDVAVVGKYTENGDAYISIAESLMHGGIANDARVNLHWIDSEELENQAVAEVLADMDAILVAPGFGARGVEGKIAAAHYAREHDVPFLGVCYGMQMAVIEFARHVAGLEEAHTEEVDPGHAPSADPYPAGAEGHRGERRDHAPRLLSSVSWWPARWRRSCTARRSSTSAIGIATN